VFTWDPGSSFLDPGLAVTPEQAQEIERLGYRTLWVTGSPAAELSFAEPFLESTTALKIATGIINIWSADAKTVAESFHRINTAYPPPQGRRPDFIGKAGWPVIPWAAGRLLSSSGLRVPARGIAETI
jgi:hypothetical protein